MIDNRRASECPIVNEPAVSIGKRISFVFSSALWTRSRCAWNKENRPWGDRTSKINGFSTSGIVKNQQALITDLMQVADFTGLLPSLSWICIKHIRFINLKSSLWKSDLMRLNICRIAACCWIRSSLWIKLLTINSHQACWQLVADCLVIIKPKQAMRTHHDILAWCLYNYATC